MPFYPRLGDKSRYPAPPDKGQTPPTVFSKHPIYSGTTLKSPTTRPAGDKKCHDRNVAAKTDEAWKDNRDNVDIVRQNSTLNVNDNIQLRGDELNVVGRVRREAAVIGKPRRKLTC